MESHQRIENIFSYEGLLTLNRLAGTHDVFAGGALSFVVSLGVFNA